MPYFVDTPSARTGAREGGGHLGYPGRLGRRRSRRTREAHGRPSSASPKSSSHRSSASSTRSACARPPRSRFLSDHGESWGERFLDKGEVAGVYHMHGATLHDEIVRVPLDPRGARARAGVVTEQVRSVDLVPTLLELAGLPARETDGESLLQVEGDRPAVIAGTDKGALSQLAVRQPPWKLILEIETGEEQAYHLATDPRERVSPPRRRPAGAARACLSGARVGRAPRAHGGGGGDGDEAALRPRLPVTALATLYERMLFVRRFEETLLDLFSQGKLVGTTHTYIGQEANGVGVIDHLDPAVDTVFSNHRCHGHYLAFTDDAFGLLSEVLGKATGHVRRQGRQPASVPRELLLERRPRQHRPGRDRDRARGKKERNRRRARPSSSATARSARA